MPEGRRANTPQLPGARVHNIGRDRISVAQSNEVTSWARW